MFERLTSGSVSGSGRNSWADSAEERRLSPLCRSHFHPLSASCPSASLVFQQYGLGTDRNCRFCNGDRLPIEGAILFVFRIDRVLGCAACSLLAAHRSVPDRFCFISTWAT